MFIAIDLQLIAQHGGTFIWPMIALSNIAQGSAALAMFWISKNQNDKSMASTSAISAYFGITEPAMFGVNLRNKFPFYAAIIGSLCGSDIHYIKWCISACYRNWRIASIYFYHSEIDSNVYCRNDYCSCNPVYFNMVICKKSQTEVGGS